MEELGEEVEERARDTEREEPAVPGVDGGVSRIDLSYEHKTCMPLTTRRDV